MEEKWLPIAGYEGRYEVSDHGRIRSFVGRSTRYLKLSPNKNGYCQVVLCQHGRCENKLVHHLVCTAFHGPIPTGKMRLHGDGVRTNNRASNLRYGTHYENMVDAGIAKLTKQDAKTIREMRRAGIKAAVIAEKYDVSANLVSMVCFRPLSEKDQEKIFRSKTLKPRVGAKPKFPARYSEILKQEREKAMSKYPYDVLASAKAAAKLCFGNLHIPEEDVEVFAEVISAERQRAAGIIEARLPLYTDIGQINALRECINSIREA